MTEPIPLRPDRRPARSQPDPSEQAATGRPERAPTPPARESTLRRADVYSRPVVDGREVRENAWSRLRAFVAYSLQSAGERKEAEVGAQLAALPGPTRSNTVAVISPKGGVGKTTSTFVLGNALASHMKLRVLAIDANPDFGTLASLAPDSVRSDRSLVDLLAELDRINSGPEMRPYISQVPTGLHLLAAPAHAEVMDEVTPSHYGEILAFLGRFYDVVLLDCGTGIGDPLARFAVERSDQTVVVSTPEWITASKVLGALRQLRLERSTLVLNQAESDATSRKAVEANFRKERMRHRVAIPYDLRLRTMLDSATYSLEGLDRPVRLPVKRLALAVGEQLV